MKNKLFMLAAICAVAISSCKKDSNSNTPGTQPSSKNPVALSKSISVWHGARVVGTPPAPTGGINAPAIDGPAEGVVKALAGKFAIIKPTLLSGSIAGYYLGISGAGDYFKVDYSKPRTGNRPFPTRRSNHFLNRPMDGVDSSIVVVLPADLLVPDTFCVTYCAYDSLGNIGQPVTTCIIVSQLGGDAGSTWLPGNWRYMGENDSVTNTFDIPVYGVMTGNGDPYSCATDSYGNSFLTRYCDASYYSCTPMNVNDSIFRYAADLSLGTNGGMSYLDSSFTKTIDFTNASCAAYSYTTSSENFQVTGGWSLAGDRMVLVFQIDELGLPDYSAEEYIVTRPDNNTMILLSADGYDNKFMFKRL